MTGNPTLKTTIGELLDREEPDYQKGSSLSAEALPILEEIINGQDTMLAARAAHLSSRIDSDETPRLLVRAARHKHREVRLAVAASARFIRQHPAGELLNTLLQDSDASVRKFAIKSFAELQTEEARPAVEAIASTDRDQFFRELAGFALEGKAAPPEVYLRPTPQKE